MRIGKTMIDLESFTEEDLTLIIKEAKNMRARKADARSYRESLSSIVANAKDNNFSICSKYTGEILNADDWLVYDNECDCLHEGEWAT